PLRFLPTFLRDTMKTLEYFFGVRVFWPLPVGLPHMDFARRRPRPCFPSPPPCGWSTGFMAVPRTVGRMPSQRLRPAFPRFTRLYSSLPIAPIEAQHRSDTRRISVDG